MVQPKSILYYLATILYLHKLSNVNCSETNPVALNPSQLINAFINLINMHDYFYIQ